MPLSAHERAELRKTVHGKTDAEIILMLEIWLALVSLLALFHVERLVMDYQLGSFILLERIAEVFLIGTLALLSWRWLWGKSINAKLRGDMSTAT